MGEDSVGPGADEGVNVYEGNGTLAPRVYGDERGLALGKRFSGLLSASIRRWRGECEDSVGEICATSV